MAASNVGHGLTGSSYRPEIDGLRALAIAAVVVHHAGFEWLPGGFAGVDVFFVISGYLITRIISDELASGRFSLWRFYERRVRRIVPALAAMLVATGIAGWLILTPEDFHHLAKAQLASAVFASNFLYARQTDYFASIEGTAPLIHTWTLGVEEQFYLVFPLLLIAMARFGRSTMLAGVGVLGAASFALAVWAAPTYPLAAFYLLPTRLWELVAGALCALLPAQRRQFGAVAMAGLALIIAGFWLITPATPAPGAMFVLPTLGTALVIRHAARASLVQRMLSLRPLTALGLVSFGVYLWHQPVLALSHYIWFGPPPVWLTGLAIIAALALGALSYRWIEQPVRRGAVLPGRLALIAATGAALAIPFATGAAGYLRHLLPLSGAQAVRLAALKPPGASDQIVIPAAQPLSFVLYGDSHAAQYYAAMQERFGSGALISNPGCLAADGVSNQHPVYGLAECLALPDHLIALAKEGGVATIFWAQRWERFLYAPDQTESLGSTTDKAAPALLGALARTADRLPGDVKIVLLGNSPTAWAAGPRFDEGWLRCSAYWNTACPQSYPANRAEGRKISARLRAFAMEDPRFAYVDAQAQLCRDGQCLLVQDGTLNYWDGSHLTLAGARRVVEQIPAELVGDGAIRRR